jgi:Gpi18-like mannosyltransferase
VLSKEYFEKYKRTITSHPLLIFLITITIRFPIAYISQGASYDMESYATIGNSVLRGNLNPYIFEGRYPYPPFWMFFEAGIVWIAYNSCLPFHFIAKIPSIFFDGGIALILYQLLERRAVIWSLSYAINPISLLVTAGHGQFDSIALFFLLLSVLLIKKNKYILSSIFLSFGILTKIYPILAIPFLINIFG